MEPVDAIYQPVTSYFCRPVVLPVPSQDWTRGPGICDDSLTIALNANADASFTRTKQESRVTNGKFVVCGHH